MLHFPLYTFPSSPLHFFPHFLTFFSPPLAALFILLLSFLVLPLLSLFFSSSFPSVAVLSSLHLSFHATSSHSSSHSSSFPLSLFHPPYTFPSMYLPSFFFSLFFPFPIGRYSIILHLSFHVPPILLLRVSPLFPVISAFHYTVPSSSSLLLPLSFTSFSFFVSLFHSLPHLSFLVPLLLSPSFSPPFPMSFFHPFFTFSSSFLSLFLPPFPLLCPLSLFHPSFTFPSSSLSLLLSLFLSSSSPSASPAISSHFHLSFLVPSSPFLLLSFLYCFNPPVLGWLHVESVKNVSIVIVLQAVFYPLNLGFKLILERFLGPSRLGVSGA